MPIYATPFGHVEVPAADGSRRRPPGRRGDGGRVRRLVGRPHGERRNA